MSLFNHYFLLLKEVCHFLFCLIYALKSKGISCSLQRLNKQRKQDKSFSKKLNFSDFTSRLQTQRLWVIFSMTYTRKRFDQEKVITFDVVRCRFIIKCIWNLSDQLHLSLVWIQPIIHVWKAHKVGKIIYF